MPSQTTRINRVRSQRVEAHEIKEGSLHLQSGSGKQDAGRVRLFVNIVAAGKSVTVDTPLDMSVNQLLERVFSQANIGLSASTSNLHLVKSGSVLRRTEASLESAGVVANETLLLTAGALPGGAYRRVNDSIPEPPRDSTQPIVRAIFDMTPWFATKNIRAQIRPQQRGPRGGLINDDAGLNENDRSLIEAFISTLRVREPIFASIPEDQQGLVQELIRAVLHEQPELARRFCEEREQALAAMQMENSLAVNDQERNLAAFVGMLDMQWAFKFMIALLPRDADSCTRLHSNDRGLTGGQNYLLEFIESVKHQDMIVLIQKATRG